MSHASVRIEDLNHVPLEPPQVEHGNYNLGKSVLRLETVKVLVNGGWQDRNALDLTSRESDLTWLENELHVNRRPGMRAILANLPIIDELITARNEAGGTRRKRGHWVREDGSMATQVLRITVRGRELQVDNTRNKFIMLIMEQEDLQFLVNEILKDLLTVQSAGNFPIVAQVAA